MANVKRIILSPDYNNICILVESQGESRFVLFNESIGMRKTDESVVDEMMKKGWISIVRPSETSLEVCCNNKSTLNSEKVRREVSYLVSSLESTDYKLIHTN